jgi:phosphate transport system substrate-binding protein
MWLAMAALSLVASSVRADNLHVLVSVPAGESTPAAFLTQVAAWRQSGQIANALFLEQSQSGHPDFAKTPAGFGSLTLIEFSDRGSFDRWHATQAATLAAPLRWRRADALAHGEITPRDSTQSAFVVNQYTPSVAPAAYRQFVQDYIVPNMEAQRAAKALIRYTMFAELDVPQPQSFLVMEYRDTVAYGRGQEVKAKFKERASATDAKWQRINDTKDRIRVAGPETYARNLELPSPDLTYLPHYVPETRVVGRLRIVGSELKNATDALAAGFKMFHPDAKLSTNFMTSSEGGIASLYFNVGDVATMGDDAKITDMMPFYNTFGYMPTEISVATGGHEKRGSLWAFAIVVNKVNPLNEISLDEIDRVFGSERTGGWELRDNNYLYTSMYARGPETNITTWGQLGLQGDYAKRRIETFGYNAPGFAIYFERNLFHWSQKWAGNFKEYVEAKQTTPDAEGRAVASERPLEDLSHNKYAIGIAGMMHVKDYPNVKVLKVTPRKGEPAVALTPETVANRTYPLKRDAFFYVNRAPGKPLDPAVREFMRFVLSREGQEIIARVNYYYPLTREYLDQQLKKLD